MTRKEGIEKMPTVGKWKNDVAKSVKKTSIVIVVMENANMWKKNFAVYIEESLRWRNREKVGNAVVAQTHRESVNQLI